MGKLKSLVSDTVIYGASTILGRMLNWLLMPFYIRTIEKAEYGHVVDIYCVIAILLVVVTFGFETGYFRFVTNDNRNRLFDSLLSVVIGVGMLVTAVFWLFSGFFCGLIGFDDVHSSCLITACLIVLVDAINAIFFAELRYDRHSVKYSLLRFFQVVVTVAFNLYFILVLKFKTYFGYDFSQISDVQYVLIANLLGSLSSIFYFLPSYIRRIHGFDTALLREVMWYCLPLMGMGFFGVSNQEIEKLLIGKLDTSANPLAELAVYGGNYKIGILMAIFTQSFRLAFEPFFFKESKESDKRDIYADVMKYFVYFGLFIYAGVVLFIPLIDRFILVESYWRGNVVIPVVLIGQLFFGVYYSLSMWYKKIDKTYFGLIMSVVGLSVNAALNYLLIPTYGFMGAAVSSLVGYAVMMVMSLALGNHYYPIKYQLWRMSFMTVGVIAFVELVRWFTEAYMPSLWFIPAVLATLFVALFMLWTEHVSLLKLLRRGKR